MNLIYSTPPIMLSNIIAANKRRDRLTAWSEVTPSFEKTILKSAAKPVSLRPRPPMVTGIAERAFTIGTKIKK